MARQIALPFLIFAFFSWLFIQESEVSIPFYDAHGKERTLNLSVKEKKRLNMFMRHLFAEDSFAYTCLGTKPMSWACYQTPFPLINWRVSRGAMSSYNRTMHKGWKVWEKYRHHFPEVILRQDIRKTPSNWVSLLIVNKKSFVAAIQDHIHDFRKVLRSDEIDGQHLLKQAEHGSLIDSGLRKHQALIGILLGYGRNNAWHFHENSRDHLSLECVWKEDEWIDTATGEQRTYTEYCLEHFSHPSFAGIPDSEESLSLKKEYMETRQRVLDYYKGKDFLEATLSLLAGHRPAECP